MSRKRERDEKEADRRRARAVLPLFRDGRHPGPGKAPGLLASATNSWQFCLLSVRRLKKREGKGRGERERESCGEPAEKGRKLGIFVSPWLFHPASPAAAALPFLVSTLPARSVPSLSAAVSFSFFCLSVRLYVRPLLLNPRPPFPPSPFPPPRARRPQLTSVGGGGV